MTWDRGMGASWMMHLIIRDRGLSSMNFITPSIDLYQTYTKSVYIVHTNDWV